MKRLLTIVLTLSIILPLLAMWMLSKHNDSPDPVNNRAAFIIADKGEMRLKTYDLNGNCMADFPMACGKNFGNKQAEGDFRTPEGIFRISQIQNSAHWIHDFGDGKGEIPGAYGEWFLRLETPPHKGIGIHGTHAPNSIGKRETEGCIRLKNEDLKKLRDYAYCGLTVVILPSEKDILANNAK